MQEENKYHNLRKQTHWENLWFYQKTVTLYDMTVVFCRRFLPAYGDRTVDQMIQAARSGKQNIVEGEGKVQWTFPIAKRRSECLPFTCCHKQHSADSNTAVENNRALDR